MASAIVLGIAFSGDVSSMSLNRAPVAAASPTPRPIARTQPVVAVAQPRPTPSPAPGARPQAIEIGGVWARISVELAEI
jgi:hypothetical protein